VTETSLSAPRVIPATLPAVFLVALEVLLALFIGFGLAVLGVGGGAWILGGVGAGALVYWGYGYGYDTPLTPNPRSRKIGQLIIGITIGLSIQHNTLQTLVTQLPVFVGLPLVLLLCGGAIGVVYARLSRTDLLTALLATTPGNIGIMASLAADYGRSTPLVSLVQLLRFTTVILVVPAIAHVPIPHSTGATLHALWAGLCQTSPQTWSLSLLLLGVAAGVVYLGSRLKIPAIAFFGAITVGLICDGLIQLFSITPLLDFRLPLPINLLGQILLGTTIGEFWAVNPKLKWSTVAGATLPVALTFLAGFSVAALAHLLTPWDWLTCLLVAAPGGSPEMILIALSLHHNVEVITTAHLIRLLGINLSLPLLLSLGLRWEQGANPSPAGMNTRTE
jgi:membrane AbrB-like protein